MEIVSIAGDRQIWHETDGDLFEIAGDRKDHRRSSEIAEVAGSNRWDQFSMSNLRLFVCTDGK